MPSTSNQETSNTSSGTSTPHKLTQKQSLTGVNIATKNGKKHGAAKDKDGGVLAAVTKNAAKLSKQQASTAKWQSPKMEPVAAPPDEPMEAPEASPPLEPLNAAPVPSANNQNTSEWAKNVPPYSSSPSNLINLGESPPTLPSSYEERGTNFGGWTARDQRIPHSHNPSASPPGRRRPLSYHLDNTYQNTVDDHLSQMSPFGRRTSLYTQHTKYPQPPLPHQVQPHFYGAPDANLLLSPRTPGIVPGENGFFCGFDSLPSQDPSKAADTITMTGYDGGLRIHTINSRGLDQVLHIDGLRGAVQHAKIIPWLGQGCQAIEYPLVALVVYGPASLASDSSSGDYAVAASELNSTRPAESVRGSPRIPHASHVPDHPSYQTSVEIYSLNTKKHLTTLLSLSRAPFTSSLQTPAPAPPTSDGSLCIRADNRYLVVSSGCTGETWIFCQQVTEQITFRCIGKVWTTIQQGLSASAPTSNGHMEGEWISADPMLPQNKQHKTPIMSIKGRWLAYCPAAPTSVVTSRAAIHGVSATARIPGLNASAPPQLPSVTCTVDVPEGESMFGKIAQVATQEMIKGAAYVGKQGMQVWNNYWNKPTNQSSTSQPYSSLNTNPQFPPTHAVTNQVPAANKDPGLVSIIDLDLLAQHLPSSGLPHPLATFRIPQGCSFLSFAPSGLALFSASSKGDTQFVWDLMRLQYVKSSLLKSSFPGAGPPGPHVRQIARFSRLTIARIVDVVWTKPHGERAAMVTEHGTVHVLDLPASAFAWPPPRRKSISSKHTDTNTGSELTGTSSTAASVASTAIGSIWSVANLANRTRRSSSVVSNATAASVASHAAHGPQAFAVGISRSVGAATGRMNEMRKFSSKQVRVQLPQSSVPPGVSCVRLISGKRNDSIIVVGGGIVRIYTIKSRRADRPADKQKPSRGAKFVEFRLPSLPDQKLVPDNLSNLHLDEEYDDVQELRWKALQPPAIRVTNTGTESSIPQAEIESNAPYQPFHTDRRVALHVLSHGQPKNGSPSVSALLSPLPPKGIKPFKSKGGQKAWAFGGVIHTTKVDVGPAPTTDDEYDAPFDHRALPSSAIERFTRIAESSENIDQIVVTTRRRKGTYRPDEGGDIDEEGFFEDDCEVLDFASQRV